MPVMSANRSLIFLPFPSAWLRAGLWCAYGPLKLGLKLALFGFVFYPPEGGFIVVFPRIIDIYVHFGHFGDWVCFGFELGLIGFVFTKCPIAFTFIRLCNRGTYTHLTFSKIGFVLHFSLIISYVIFRRSYLVYREA
jgi:hypothetical protein